MIAAGRVFAAVPPLHRIEVRAQGRRRKEIIYTYSDDELFTTLRRLERQGRSFSDPVYDENGVEDQERSRRVEIKFRLKDAEMIQRMNSILSSME